MSIVKIKDKTFKTSIPEAEIKKRVKALADRINNDMADKNPLLLAMLNGSFVFAADLMREITVPAEISFVKMSSYAGTSSTGKVKQLIGLNDDIKGRTIIIVEDIIESGLTMKAILAQLAEKQPEAIHICTLLLKPDCLETYATRHSRFPTTSLWATDLITTNRDATSRTYTQWWKNRHDCLISNNRTNSTYLFLS